MSLEVDGRAGSVPISYQREDEGFKFTSGGYFGGDPSHAQNPNTLRTNGEQIQVQQLSQPKHREQGRKVQVRPGFMLCQRALCALVLMLAVVAASVAGSIAARRGKHLDAWFALTLEMRRKHINSDHGAKV